MHASSPGALLRSQPSRWPPSQHTGSPQCPANVLTHPQQLQPGPLRSAAVQPVAAVQPPQLELMDRLMFAQANEAARCLEEGVLRSVADANIGSIFGWGFAPFHGGALQFINAMGAAAFVERSRELAAAHGSRFEPAAVVVQQAQSGGRFTD